MGGCAVVGVVCGGVGDCEGTTDQPLGFFGHAGSASSGSQLQARGVDSDLRPEVRRVLTTF